MELKIYEDYAAMSKVAAGIIIHTVQKKPNALFCFATGDTPKLAYQILAETAKKDGIDFSNCLFIGLDEWLGIAPDNTGSCHHFLYTHLFKPLSIDPAKIYLFDALAPDAAQECRKMNELLEEKGPVDLMLVGVGMNGHIGFNEPGTPVDSIAHVSALDNTTKTIGKKYFEQEVTINKGLTLGLKQVMDAHTLVMIANGKKKAEIVKKTVENPISHYFPASLIRNHKNSILMIDEEASSELETATNAK